MHISATSDQFLAVIQKHKGIIYKVANAYCKDADDRKDLVQEVIVQLWSAFARYDDQFKHSTWVYRIALNVAISFYRKETRRRVIANPFTEGILSIEDEPEAHDWSEETGLLQQFINELKGLDKALLLLYLEEKPYKEISGIMGISESNVATKIGRIKAALKKKFEQLTIN
jgi:RNA polymerase sigma factor (sigma-70 family)